MRNGSSLLGLVKELKHEVKIFIREEIQLAKTEIGEKISCFGGNSAAVAIGGFIADFCRNRNLEFKFQDVEGERRNLLAWVPGSGDDKLLFVAHMDTVPICIGSQPKVDGDFVRSANPASGLGADDHRP